MPHTHRGLIVLNEHALLHLQVSLSVVEIYCERIRDLLSRDTSKSDNMAIKQDTEKGIYVEGIAICQSAFYMHVSHFKGNGRPSDAIEVIQILWHVYFKIIISFT